MKRVHINAAFANAKDKSLGSLNAGDQASGMRPAERTVVGGGSR